MSAARGGVGPVRAIVQFVPSLLLPSLLLPSLLLPVLLLPSHRARAQDFGEEAFQLEQTDVSSPVEYLELLGVSESELGNFISQTEFRADEAETLIRLLQALPRMPAVWLHRWQRDFNAAEVSRAPGEFRGEWLRIQGRLKKLATQEVPVDVAERMGFARYYEAHLEIAAADDDVRVFLRSIPTELEPFADESAVDERVRVTGMFLKSGPVEAGPLRLFFAASRLEWYPERKSASEKGRQLSQIADLGVDVGRLDTVQDRQPLTSQDREAFYQMLAAAAHLDSAQWDAESRWAGAVDLLQNPAAQRGRFFRYRGTARQQRCGFVSMTPTSMSASAFRIIMKSRSLTKRPLSGCDATLPMRASSTTVIRSYSVHWKFRSTCRSATSYPRTWKSPEST